jgi:hypothetical protein
LSDSKLVDVHEYLVQHLLLETEEQHAVQGRVTDDAGAMECTGLELACGGGQGRDSLVGDVADLWMMSGGPDNASRQPDHLRGQIPRDHRRCDKSHPTLRSLGPP